MTLTLLMLSGKVPCGPFSCLWCFGTSPSGAARFWRRLWFCRPATVPVSASAADIAFASARKRSNPVEMEYFMVIDQFFIVLTVVR